MLQSSPYKDVDVPGVSVFIGEMLFSIGDVFSNHITVSDSDLNTKFTHLSFIQVIHSFIHHDYGKSLFYILRGNFDGLRHIYYTLTWMLSRFEKYVSVTPVLKNI